MFWGQIAKRWCISCHPKLFVGSISDVIYNLHSIKLASRFSSSSRKLNTCNVVHFQKVNSLQPKLSPQEVTQILRQNEQSLQLREESEVGWDEAIQTPSMHAIASADSNQLASNTPIEDKLAVSKCLLTTGFLFGVFDGHGGPECSQVVSKRIFDYIAASLLPRSELRHILSEFEKGRKVLLTKVFNDDTEFVPELQRIYDASFVRWCEVLLRAGARDFSMEDALSNAFLHLDLDLSTEILEHRDSTIFPTLLRVATAGSVACVAHVDGPHLHVASAGDCGAVLGRVAEGPQGGWVVNRLTNDHNWENSSEVRRVLNEHPKEEHEMVIHNQRLLGMLMPFRAFGDVRFKWERGLQQRVIQPMSDMDTTYLSHCLTPPYLTARPEVAYHRLSPHERFLVLASDGLWEAMNAVDVVALVGEYMSGRQTLQPVRLPRRNVTLGEMSRLLHKRQEGLRLKPSDTNAATYLIRHCLGGTDEGLDHLRLSHSLTLPPEVRRYFRDDISIHVVFFDANFLRVCPIEL